MNHAVMTALLGAAQGIVGALAVWKTASKGARDFAGAIAEIDTAAARSGEMKARLVALREEFVPFEEVREKVQQLRRLREGLKVEKGRATITQAELETVEGRLRELEEIERELTASSTETKEELKILEKKEKDLNAKNEALKTQLRESMSRLDELFSQMEASSEIQEQVDKAKSEMVSCQTQIDTLLMKIEEGNDQYFVLKQRYDALDIEYAQLYEKYTESNPQG